MSDFLQTWLSERLGRRHASINDRLANIETLLKGLPQAMSDALAIALQPLDAGVTQISADVLNFGSVVSADFTALQGSIAALQGSITAGGTVPAADLADIASQVSLLAQAHTALTNIITNLGTAASGAAPVTSGTVTSGGTATATS